jgi:hypothetical protein
VEVVAVTFTVLFRDYPGVTEEIHENASVQLSLPARHSNWATTAYKSEAKLLDVKITFLLNKSKTLCSDCCLNNNIKNNFSGQAVSR